MKPVYCTYLLAKEVDEEFNLRTYPSSLNGTAVRIQQQLSYRGVFLNSAI